MTFKLFVKKNIRNDSMMKYDKNATEGWALNVIQVHWSQQLREFISKKHFLGNIECSVWDISSMLNKECTYSQQVQTGSEFKVFIHAVETFPSRSEGSSLASTPTAYFYTETSACTDILTPETFVQWS